jgi:flagellar hook-associated protein 1 FlgK
MLGLFNTLNLGARSMMAEELSLEVTGQNLANANNPAYTRQTVDLQASTPTPTNLGLQGTGVDASSIQQVSDPLLNSQIQSEASVGGYWNSQQTALENAQTQLGEFLNLSSSGTGSTTTSTTSSPDLSDQLNNLFNAFQSVATSPTDPTARQSLVNSAQSLASSFNQASQNLNALNGQLNTSVGNDVTSANQLLTDIASLNGQIAQITASGGTANDLVDSREQDLENLAQLANTQTTANPDGTISVSIGGQQLVSGGTLSDTLATYDPGNSRLQVQTAASATPLTLSGGSIQGTIDARDDALGTLRSNLNTMASTLITQVNSIYQNGYDLNGSTGADFFTGTGSGNIGVNSALLTDPSQIQASGVASAAGDNSVALALAQLRSQSVGALNNQTFSSACSLDVESFGNALANANDQVNNYNSVNTMLLNQRDSVSGVSLEQEMANLITFQKAYETSAQIITTVNEMLTTVVNMKSG